MTATPRITAGTYQRWNRSMNCCVGEAAWAAERTSLTTLLSVESAEVAVTSTSSTPDPFTVPANTRVAAGRVATVRIARSGSATGSFSTGIDSPVTAD